MAILIKRYANRKLYNTDTSRYITLKGIAKLLDEGEEVRVVDNETGDDITQVALSQILVDNKRAKEDPSDTLLTQILSRGGDALYGAIRKSVDDATEGIGDFQERFRHLVGQADPTSPGGLGFPWDRRPQNDPHSDPHSDESSERDRGGSRRPGADADSAELTPELLEKLVRDSVIEVIESLDLPRRRDLETLNRNFERVAKAVERLERAYLPPQQGSTQPGINPRIPAKPGRTSTE
jgi:polyhydroxyalkanoate synthesis repressor PhaR